MTTVLAIDQGTSGTKAVVVDGGGSVLALSEVTVRPTYLPGGGVEQDPQALLESVLTAGRQAVAEAKVPIDVVTLANQGETVLAWDPETGRPLSPMIVWQDRRCESICAELRPHAELIAQKTGLVLDPYFSAPKQAWIRRNITTDGVVTTSDSWLVFQLTGEFVTDASTASRSLVLDLDSGEWDPELLALFGLDGERLPRILSNTAVAGVTTLFGGGEIPVGGLIVDQQAALVAERCLQAGEAKCTFGTGAFLLANTGTDPVRSRSGLSTSIAWQQDGQNLYCLDGQIYTAASAVRWLEQLTFINSARDLDKTAAPDSEGVMCVPALAGLAAPWWRPDATATITGMTLSTGSQHLVRAVLEGIAAQVAEVARSMAHDLGQPLQRLRVDGGLTQSKVLMQSVADLVQIPVDVYPSQHATPLGAAALARVAVTPGLALDDAIVDWKPTLSFEPEWSADRAADFSTRWRRIADLTV
ncbi:glycerol kinase [Curtobacterium pusillum]|uniref:ATP:glycerol 3-phosphotransferase n=1 Tax=Curtobacterium pusillum TaxID=69373 RepID=A0AAW3T6X1_9MICO|nr:FGGY family carbohydrate kinase [Curtobacterium pusillum]MBA8990763.1 glycerol kinase [Curtobacterium pusillum]